MHTRKQRGRGLLFANGGTCGSCMLQDGNSSTRIGVLFPRFGGTRKQPGKQRGAGCGCGGPKIASPWRNLTGGYHPTAKNLKYLAKWKRGESIGFTMRSSLKAKGLLPRSNGTYKVSPKYRHK